MPRLTKQQSVEYYGRNLPTPTIEKITLSNVQSDDEIYDTLRIASEATGTEVSDAAIETITRIDTDISFHFSTDEDFKVEEFEKNLFDAGAEESLYITLYLSYSALGDNQKVFKTNIIKEFDNNSGLLRETILSYPRGTVNYTEAGIGLLAIGKTDSLSLVSVPLSDFHSVAELTSDVDADDNAVIRVTNIKITTYVRNFTSRENINVFCCASTRHPYEIETPTSFSLDPITVSMNYSDVTYEQIVRNSTLATFSEPVFVDAQGLHYPNYPLASINKKYYKTEEYGSKEVFDSVNALLAEYEARSLLDEELQRVTDQVKLVLAVHENDVEFLQQLNKAAQGFSVTSTESQAIAFNQRFRDLINNADAILRQQEEVVKRIFRNYKIVDSRDTTLPEFTAYSYVTGLQDKDFLYQNIFNTNIANYVPMITAPADYPGKAELPATPAEMVSEFREDALSIRKELESIMIPFTTPGAAASGATTFSGVTYTGVTAGVPSATPAAAAAAATSPVKEKIDAAVRDMADWCFNVWAGRFIKGSAHPAYQNADGHSGAHYYVVNLTSPSIDTEPSPSEWNWAPDRDDYGITGDEVFYWDDTAPGNYEIARWANMVGTLPTAEWQNHERQITAASTADFESGDEYYEDILNKFGYVPSRDASRPDSSPRNGGPAYTVTWNTDPAVTEYVDNPAATMPRTWRWFDQYFWTPISMFQLSALYYLAQQEHQIEFFVPKDASGPVPTLEETIEDSLAATALGDLVGELGGESVLRFQFANKYMSDYYEKVGGISPLHRNSIDSDSERRIHQLIYDTSADAGGDYRYTESKDMDGYGIGWWRCARRKYNDIYQKVEQIFYSVYGIDPDTLAYEAGSAALVDGPPPVDTNTATTLDTYISEGPLRIAEKVISDTLEKIDNRPADDFDTEAERDNWTNVYTDQIIEAAFSEIETYYDKKFCKIYACTALPDEKITTFWEEWRTDIGGPAPLIVELPDSTKIRNLDYVYAVGRNRGEDVYPNIAYGGWGGLTISETVEGETSSSSNTHIINLGQAFIDLLKENINTNRDRIRQTIKRYITAHALFTGFNSDIGIHSALAEVDIVLSKYGYFFFDMEKYIRKNSHLSKVLNVDRLLIDFPSAKQMTNAACRLKEVGVKLDNFGVDPATGLTTTTTAAKLRLVKDESNIVTTSFINDFKELEFETPIDPKTGRPRVYRRINALQAISFDQITEYTGARELASSAGTSASDTFRQEADRVLGGSAAPTTTPATGTGGYTLSDSITDFISSTAGPRLGAGTAAQQEALAGLTTTLADRLSVDITDLVTDVAHAPKQMHTGLVMRNYAFPGFANAALLGGKVWRNDYRMMMFKYQFFLDDDDAFSFAGDPELDDGNVSYDNLTFDLQIVDNSPEIFYTLVQKFRKNLKLFKMNYVDFAEEACAFNSFDQNFNRFFVDQMLIRYPTPPKTPWHTMVATYISYTNIMTESYRGDRLTMFEAGNNILELIRPETGNLNSLRLFYENCESMLDKLISAEEVLRETATQTIFDFTYEDVIGAAVIDHIGDYSDRLEDPRVSEFGGDEDLYGIEDF